MSTNRFCRYLVACAVPLVLAVGGCSRGGSGPGSSRPSATAAGGAAPVAAAKPIKTKTGIEMVLIPAGEFLMGDDAGDEDEKPAHRVQIGSFYMDATEVTQESFQALMGRNPSKSIDPKHPDKPAERVSWLAAIQYCNMRSAKEGLAPCYDLNAQPPQCRFDADGYRLPTEAEWEYACRAGTATRWSFGNNPADLAKHGWFKANADKTTHPVKEKLPNPWGLYDVYGNVAEWCNDFYGETYDPAEAKDPRGAAAGDERVMRGGSFMTEEDVCRSSTRRSQTPVFADTCFGSEAFGFRCVRRVDDAPPVSLPSGEGGQGSSEAQAKGKPSP